MIVDDEPSVARVTGLMMKRLGHKVRTFSDPVLALKELDRSPVDCLITDHSMPGMTGTELTAAARGLYPDLPVIICSGYGARLNEQLVLGSGARALLWKPLDFTHLGEVVESIAINPHPRPWTPTGIGAESARDSTHPGRTTAGRTMFVRNDRHFDEIVAA
jgi:CheY-like chemotaxis protein